MPDRKGRLTHREKVFVERMAATGDSTYAAYKAGYSSPQQRGSQNMLNPALAAAVRKEQDARLQHLRGVSIDRLEGILTSKTSSDRIVLDAIKTVLNETRMAPVDEASVDLADLSAAELGRAIAELRGRLGVMKSIPPVIDAEPAEPPRLPDPLPSETSVFG